jgi:adenine-specific DNA-methyltransferase
MKPNDLFKKVRNIEPKFTLDAHIVLSQGDVNDFLDTIPGGEIKLIVTSPPYNVGKEYETRVAIEKYLDEQAQIIGKLYRVLSPDGSICWQVGNYIEKGEVFPLDIYYYQIFKSLGMHLRNRIIWRYSHGLHAKRRFSGRYETLLWFTKSDEYTFNLDNVRIPSKYPGKRHYKGPKKGQPSGNPKGKNPSNFWEIISQEWEEGVWEVPNVKAAHPEKTIHPTQFPIEIVERCVLALTNEEERVLDPYVGVGTSIIAAIRHNRRGLGSEKGEEYIKIAKERIWEYFGGTLPYRTLGKPIYKPSPNEKVAKMPQEWQQPSFDDLI